MKLPPACVPPANVSQLLNASLLDGRARHVSAEQLRDELVAYGQPMALATIYNCLHQFEEAGCCAQFITLVMRCFMIRI